MFSDKDIRQIQEKGISDEQLQWQLSVFRKGIAPMKLNRPASIGDGIICPDNKEIDRYISDFDSAGNIQKIKFVPASGAASRMFKALFEFMDSADEQTDSENEFIITFFGNLRKFAFYSALERKIRDKGESLNGLPDEKKYKKILEYLLTEKGLNYGNLPKGLLQFHHYERDSRTPFEEHIREAVQYAKTQDGKVTLHFTVSPEHLEEFRKLLHTIRPVYEQKNGIVLDVSFSVQKPSTDTIAVDSDNQPFRENDGSIVFRPGGHGALIDNLNELDADIIFIKNIDNVVPEKLNSPTIRYKKALAGILLETQKKVFKLLNELDAGIPPEKRLQEMYKLITGILYYIPASKPVFTDAKACVQKFREILNRPIRVCGVVKNLGEPGGGPFWAHNSKGDLSLQIVESSQVDHFDAKQAEIFKRSTHFNPVDLVCSTKNFRGEKFHLPDYIDRNTCFISKKSKDGRDLKALELPGLWNGAMADWLTLMVEVPMETFNPVKTVNDLLRPQHQ
ncbi:MAG: DUF4301 family protein [Bacteroidales bacterium]|nr:DUF4301 family protein [Bacteroidales bacterium]